MGRMEAWTSPWELRGLTLPAKLMPDLLWQKFLSPTMAFAV